MKKIETEQNVLQRLAFTAVADSVCAVCGLSTVPTQDWTTRAAEAVAKLSRSGSVCVAIVREQGVGAPSSRLRVESVGLASVGNGLGGFGGGGYVEEAARSRIERVQEYGFSMTEEMRRSGVVGHLGAMNTAWREVGFGRAWAGMLVQEALVAVIPVVPSVPNTAPKDNISLVCMLGESEPAVSIDAFYAVISRLCLRVRAMFLQMESIVGAGGNGIRWLTSREQEVLGALVRGLSVREIAEEFGRSRHTVHDHVKSLHKKLSASSRGELVSMAMGYRARTGEPVPFSPVMMLHDVPKLTTCGDGMIAEMKPSAKSVVDPTR